MEFAVSNISTRLLKYYEVTQILSLYIYIVGHGEIVFTWLFKDKVNVRSYPLLPDFRKSITFLKIPRFRPFVLLVTAACRWISVWSIRGMIWTRENLSTRRETCLSATLSTTNLTWTDLGSNMGFRGEGLATNRLSHRTVI
jgi:hypothetical protein